MKKYLYLLLTLAFAFSCLKPEPDPQPVKGEITLKSDAVVVLSDAGSSEQVEFTATLEWKASSDQEWLTVEPKAGLAGEWAVTMTAEKNTSEEPRTASVTLTCGEDKETIEVTQKQAGALLLAQSMIQVAAEGGKISVTAKSNSNATAVVDAAAQPWITDVTTKAMVDYIFDFEIAANESEQPRSGRIVFSNSDGKSETVTIEQAGAEVDPEVEGNVYGKVTCNGAGVPDVLVSDGVEIVKTDAEGNYRFQSDKKWRYVFVINPAGYDFPLNGILPANYKLLSQNAETEEQVDFELVKTSQDNYTLLIVGDMHLANRTKSYLPKDQEQFVKVAEDINASIAAASGKVYVLTLGDMTWDEFWVKNNYGFTEYLQTMNSYFTDVPFFHTMGNHDNEMEVGGDWEKSLKYTQNLAPNYYSFNIGGVHFMSLDNIDCTGVSAGSTGYKEDFTTEQFEWIKKDLSYVDRSTPVFVYSHAPLTYPSNNSMDADASEFVALFDGFNVKYFSGHTHNMFHQKYTSTFEEYNSGSLCGSWWWSQKFTPDVHLSQDGAPGGYTVCNINGTECRHYYKSVGHDRDYQFRAYDMNKVKELMTEEYGGGYTNYTKFYQDIQAYGENVILVNLWAYGEDWKIEISENGTSLAVEHIRAYDPLHIAALTVPGLKSSDDKDKNPSYVTERWSHFFQATASTATSTVTVKVADPYGNVYTEVMTRPKAFTVSEYKNNKDEADALQVSKKASTSSTLTFEWTGGSSIEEDIAKAYTATLYTNASCTAVEQSFEIPAGSKAWSERTPRFVFGGLAPSTDYWFKVVSTTDGSQSQALKATTEAFTIVEMPASITGTGVVLAEDFGELRWDYDRVSTAAGFFPLDNTDFANTAVDSGKNNSDSNSLIDAGYHASGKSGEIELLDLNTAMSNSRLDGWLVEGPVYAHPGYVRLSNSSTKGWIYTPEFTVPSGKKAVVTVSITAGRHDKNQESDWGVSVLTPELTRAEPDKHTAFFDWPDTSDETLYKEISFTNNNTWATSTVSGLEIRGGERIIFGPKKGGADKKSRLQVSDVTVTVTELVEE